MVILFDGYCGLCNKSIDFIIKYDSKRQFKFSPIQGTFAKELSIPTISLTNPDSIIVWANGLVLQKSSAVFFILKKLPYPWKLFLIFSILPQKVSDRLYDFIARKRYQWFTKSKTCRIPSYEQRSLFLD